MKQPARKRQQLPKIVESNLKKPVTYLAGFLVALTMVKK